MCNAAQSNASTDIFWSPTVTTTEHMKQINVFYGTQLFSVYMKTEKISVDGLTQPKFYFNISLCCKSNEDYGMILSLTHNASYSVACPYEWPVLS